MTNPVNITGYLRDSPHRHNDFNLIKSKNITMNNVDIPLLLRPNKGKSLIAMPNSGEYKFPKADFVTEIPLAKYQTGSPECPRGYIWDNVIQQCVPAPQDGAINPNQRIISAPASKANFDQITGQNTTDQNNNVNETQEMRLKRMFGKPNIPAILGTNLLAFGLSAFSNNVEEGRQRGFAMNQINNPLFNQTYSNAQNDYGVDPYEQTGQLRKQYQQGGTVDPLSQQKAFYNLYMNSPKYLERLNKQGYSNPEQVIKDRLANVNATKENRTSEFNASAYRATNQDILMDPNFNKANNLDEDTVRTHEMGHAGGALSRQYDNISPNVMMNQNDIKLLEAKNQSFNSHDRMPSEMKADMDTLRYMMKKDGSYDAGTQDFDKTHYKQAKQKYSSDPVIGRLFQNTGTNDLITLMNTVAQAPDPKERAGGNFMQQGGKIDPLKEQKNFYDTYLTSANYKKRLTTQGYTNIPTVINSRKTQLDATKFVEFPGNGSEYKKEFNTVVYDPKEAKKYGDTPSVVKAHEMAHAAGASGVNPNWKENISNITLNAKEITEINKRNKTFQKEGYLDHDGRAGEFKADMDAMRFMLKRDKIYDTGTQEFNQEFLNKAKEKYKNNTFIKRVFDRASDKDLIYLMNNIAKNDTPNRLPTAQQGGRIPIQVTNPNDSRLRAYNDSLTLYNRSKGMIGDLKNYEKKYPKDQLDDQWLNYANAWYDKNEKATGPAFQRLTKLNKTAPTPPTYTSKVDPNQVAVEYTKPVQPVVYQKLQQKNTYADSLALYQKGLENKKKIDNPRELIYGPNEELDVFMQDKNTEAYKDYLRTGIRPDREYFGKYKGVDGIGKMASRYEYAYKKPVGSGIKPPVIEKAPIVKPVINPRFKGKDTTQMGASPIPSGNPAITAQPYDFTNPTPFSFTQANGQYLHQATTYFPSESALRMYSKDKRAVSIQASKDGAIATGYQRGGKFNAYEYVYGDDEETQDTPKPTDVPKRKRIVEDQIDTTDDQDAMDIANMDSIVRSQRTRQNAYTSDSAYTQDSSEASNYALMYLKHQQGAAGIDAIKKAASQGLDAVPRSWNKENIQANMKNNIGKDFQGPLTPANFINYWAGKVNRHMQIASNKQTPYDNIFNQIGQQEGVNPIFLKAVANMESGLNPNNNTGSKYKGLFAQNSNTFKGNIFDPVQATKVAAKNFKQFEQGGEFSVDFETLKELQKRGIKFNIL